ncbi:hypothetical protein CRG98_022495 [Punica granatum]|uniref:Leucine-rich repeat-containing N-terminal plant-type domain-containing protein n=1 Tax=Punica granatum TaxID=22663 RepID=A0A2I0JLE9_PUNGR|nr:hypothetical protein CRG98_022495 [Punica granatum]
MKKNEKPSALLLILLEFCGSGRLSSACIEPERIGLIKLKAAFNLPNGSTFPWWRDDQGDCCRWEGVWCNNISMRVTMLLLNDTRDSRLGPWSLNASLFLPFEELEALDLGFNQLTDCRGVSSFLYFLPLAAFTETLRLKRLQVLDLRTNELTEVPSLHELPSLNALYLQFNYRLKNLSRLEGLKLEAVDVSFNHLAGDSLSAIWSMTSLKALSIAGNQLGDSIFQETAYTDDQLVEVKFISKSRLESYRGNILEYMSGLDLSCNNLTGSIPQEIGYMINLLILNLSNNHLMGPIPSTFSGLKQIESLDLSYNRLTGKIPPQLTELSFLSIFTVAHNNLSGQTPERKNQFATFDERSYEGNIFLCGPPLESCNTSGQSPLTPPIPDQKEDYAFRDAFTWSFAGSYVIAFLGTVAFLFMLNFFR